MTHRRSPEILVGNNPDELTACLIDILSHPDKAANIAAAAMQFVHQHYKWHATTMVLNNAMKAAIDNAT